MMKVKKTSIKRNMPEFGKSSSPMRPTKARIVPKITKYIIKIRMGQLFFTSCPEFDP
jgi:hypothetical protein